jgi:hypothetical protein
MLLSANKQHNGRAKDGQASMCLEASDASGTKPSGDGPPSTGKQHPRHQHRQPPTVPSIE